jgi:hypothetical protein
VSHLCSCNLAILVFVVNLGFDPDLLVCALFNFFQVVKQVQYNPRNIINLLDLIFIG